MNDQKPFLQFGANGMIPDGTPAAWGARLIVKQDGYTDFVPDRQSAYGDSDELIAALNDGNTFREIRDTISKALRDYRLVTSRKTTIAFQIGRLVVAADTAASFGYCYVAAWFSTSTDERG